MVARRKDESRRRDDEDVKRRLLAAIDRRLGIPAESEDAAVQDFERATPAPLPAELVDRILADVRERRPRAGAGDDNTRGSRRRRRWWLRASAIVPFALLVLTASTLIYWSGRRSRETLSYEEALRILLDHDAPVGRRASAQGKVYVGAKQALLAIKTCADAPGVLGNRARVALKELRRQIAGPPDMVQHDHVFPDGHQQQHVPILRDPGSTRQERLGALDDVLALTRIGVAALHASASEERLATNARIWLEWLRHYSRR